VDKDLVSTASGGDILLYVATGASSVLGGFRTGSIFGSGYGIFGWFYPLIIGLLAIFTFTLADAQTTRIKCNHTPSQVSWQPIFGPMTIIGSLSWVFYFTSGSAGTESMSSFANFLIRGWVQLLFIYAIVYWVTYFAIKPFNHR
jgi:hypothetical protein